MDDTRRLEQLLDTRVPLIVIETFEERRALDMLMRVAAKRHHNLFRWSETEGLQRSTFGPQIAYDAKHTEPKAALQYVKDMSQAGIFAFCDLHSHLADSAHITRLVKDIALNHLSVPHTLVFISYELTLPPEIARYSTTYTLSMPSDDQIMDVVRQEAKLWSDRNGQRKVRTDSNTIKKLVSNLQGLAYSDVKRLVRGAIVDDGEITDDDLPALNKAKFELMDMEGIMHFEYNTEAFGNVGGLARLKQWLQERQQAFISTDGQRDCPKGMLLLGVQGGGKSLAAKAVSGLWQLPLLRLDMGALYNKFFGETERNLREALALADSMSPCILWLDEIEKGMARDGNDNGTSRRILGTMLTWMAERQSKVFLVATSNDISNLPPELVRKGRFDEIFFVDLPKPEVRNIIFDIHLAKRGYSSSEFDLAHLSERADGFSGAEIEQAIIAAMYTADGKGEPLTTDHIIAEVANTSPLSVVMAEQIQQLRRWAESRAVMAD